MSLETGRVCIKLCGREAGEKAVILSKVDENFVTVIGPKVRKRKCNISHLFPTGQIIKVTKSVTQKELQKEMDDMNE